MAWFWKWQTKDLVWSLWLSSLVVGYSMIVWGIFGPAAVIGSRAWRDRADIKAGALGSVGAVVGGGVVALVIGLFLLAFFTVHFGMFHFVHSVFLNTFFPMIPGTSGFPNATLYAQVVASYWPFVILAAIAERQAFVSPAKETPLDTSVTAEAIAARKARNAATGGMTGMMAPYRNVIRLHLLIFFFAFASFTHIDNFAVYAVVYAVYFFPWRLLKKSSGV